MRLLSPILLLIPALVVHAESRTAPEPKQSIKAEIRVMIDGKDTIVLLAKKPELSARSNLLTSDNFWRLLFNSNQPSIPAGSFSFSTTVDPNDLPGGGFYLCTTRDDGDNFYFNISGLGGAPKKDFVLFKPSEISSIKNQDNSFTYSVPAPLKPGRYALYFADNQYAWPFVVK